MDRVMQHNVLAMSGKAVEASGDVTTLLLDKTGTITLGNRQAVEFLPVHGVPEADLADAAQLSSLADETPEGRSIVILAKDKYNLRGRELSETDAQFVPFSAYTRMSGVDLDRPQPAQGRDGRHPEVCNGERRQDTRRFSGSVRSAFPARGGTPLAVADGGRLLGIVHLKDIVKGGMKERLAAVARDGHSLGHDHRR